MNTTILYSNYADIDSRLSQLDVTSHDLRDAVLVGQSFWDSCTNNDPACLPGIIAWGKTIKTLREILIPKTWERREDRNFPTVFNPAKNIAIAVAAGDEGTGTLNTSPKTKYPRGPATRAAVKKNIAQLEFGFAVSKEQSIDDLTTTWLLLVFRTQESIFYELSLPAAISDDGYIEKWKERLVFESIPLNLEPTPKDLDSGPEIVVEVARKG